MSLADIDAGATGRRIREIADAARRSFEAHAQRSAEIGAESREALAKEEADRRAVEARLAEIEARKAEKAAAAREQAPEETKPKPKTTLSLGADEFARDRQARQAAPDEARPPQPSQSPTQPPPAPEPAGEPARSARTLRLGAPEVRDDGPPLPVRPARPKRPPRPEGDDDMSGRTWLR